MTGNMQDAFGNDTAQLNALMQVINEITQYKVPHYQMHELTSKSTLRELQYLIDDCNALDDSDMIDVLNQTKTEIKYLASVINDLRERIKEREIEIGILKIRIENLQADGQMMSDRLRRGN